MQRAEIDAVLAKRGWLAGYDARLRQAILARARPAIFAADDVVFHAGDLAGGIFGIARGAFVVALAPTAAGPAAATIIRAGVWFGNGPLVAGRRRMLSFRAAEPSVTLHLPLNAIRELSAARIEAARCFADLAGLNMAAAIRTASDLLIPRTERRIAATLLRITSADEGECPDDRTGFRLRHADLGEMANASRRSVVQALATFEARGWVALGYQRIAIVDAVGLARHAYG